MNKLWRIKQWFKYEPSIFFDKCVAKLFHGLAELTDRLGYLIFGKVRWEKAKREQAYKDKDCGCQCE
jgi:hypothetical protein